MNFFKFDGIDTVASETKEQAIEFYVNETGFYKEDISEIEQVPGRKMMWVEMDFLTEEEMNQRQIIQRGPYGELEVKMPFDEVYKREKQKAPYIIASTER